MHSHRSIHQWGPLVIALSACRTAPGLATSGSSKTHLSDLAYVANGGTAQRLDLFVPEGTGPFPTLVWIHGGAWRAGDKKSCPVRYLTTRGYVVASVNYRLSGEAKFPAQLDDVKAAIGWLRDNSGKFGIDPTRIAVAGDSAGGHLASLVGTTADVPLPTGTTIGNSSASSRVAAVVTFYGPSDLLQMDRQARDNMCPEGSLVHDAPESPESQLIGCSIQTCPERARQANPITHISAAAPPFLIEHGDRDCTVPPGQGQLLHKALRAAGVESTLVTIPKGSHGGAPFDKDRLERFLAQTLRVGRP